jgi:hypothetical protein
MIDQVRRPRALAHRERPGSCCAAEQRDELAAFQLIELHSIPASRGRVAGYRIGNGQSAGAGVILQPVSAEDHGGSALCVYTSHAQANHQPITPRNPVMPVHADKVAGVIVS